MTTTSNQLYERDFYAWTVAITAALKSGDWQEIDLVNLIEEVEAMGRSQKAASECYLDARVDAAAETGLAEDIFPIAPPFTLQEAIAPKFQPWIVENHEQTFS